MTAHKQKADQLPPTSGCSEEFLTSEKFWWAVLRPSHSSSWATSQFSEVSAFFLSESAIAHWRVMWMQNMEVRLVELSSLVFFVFCIIASKQTHTCFQTNLYWLLANTHTVPQGQTVCFIFYLTVQCEQSCRGLTFWTYIEYINPELWLYITADLLIQ